MVASSYQLGSLSHATEQLQVVGRRVGHNFDAARSTVGNINCVREPHIVVNRPPQLLDTSRPRFIGRAQ